MGSLVNQISQITDARYGVNILEEAPPGSVRGAGTNIVAAVADLPWGPVDTITEITSSAELFSTFCPDAFGSAAKDAYTALKAFVNKTFPNGVKVYRISPTGQATATKVYDDASAGDSVTVTARYPGLLGNSISIAWSANADDATARDATVTIGTTYSVVYKRVATIVATVLTVTDPGDPFVVFTKSSGATLVPVAAAASALATGADGTSAAGDYTTGIDAFSDASVAWNVGFVAEAPSSMADAINAGMKSFVDANKRGIWVMVTPAAQAYATAKAYPSTYRADRLVYPWPLVKTVNVFDANRAEITVSPSSFAAAAIASVAPEKSPGGAPGAPYMKGITGLELGATSTQLNELVAAGVTPMYMSDALEGAIMHNCVLTTLTTGQTKVFRRRMTDYIVLSLAAFLERFVGELLDINLVTRALGAVTGPEIGSLQQFLADLVTTNRIREYSLDPFGGNVQSNIDAGQWIILLRVKLISAQEQIVLKAQIGETVVIDAEV